MARQIAAAFGELLHTGLRKGVDSNWSALAWNLIHALPEREWADFVGWAGPIAEQWPTPVRSDDVRALFDGWHDAREALWQSRYDPHIAWALRAIGNR